MKKTLHKIAMTLGWIWAFPVTLFGLLFAAGGGVDLWGTSDFTLVFVAKKDGLMMKFFEKYGFGGLTVGTVIFLRESWYVLHPEIMNHEGTHARQAMALGALFPLAYYGSSLAMAIVGKKAYDDNPFEKHANLSEAAGRVLNLWETK